MNNRNNMVPVCVRGLGLVTCCLCVKRLFEISIVSCRVCSITAIGWKRFASLNDKVLSFQNKGKSFSPFHTVKSHSPTLDITKLLAEKSKLRSKYHRNFEEKSGLWRVKNWKSSIIRAKLREWRAAKLECTAYVPGPCSAKVVQFLGCSGDYVLLGSYLDVSLQNICWYILEVHFETNVFAVFWPSC